MTSDTLLEEDVSKATASLENETDPEIVEIQETEETAAVENAVVYLHVCGAVVKPDVYELHDNDRIMDAIRAAGGFTDGADENFLNLALPVADGMKVYVPTIKEVEEGYTQSAFDSSGSIPEGREYLPEGQVSTSGKVNINNATAEQLKTLSGIGDKRAGDIISYRESHGDFGSIEDIMNVPGIKAGVFEKIKEDIEV